MKLLQVFFLSSLWASTLAAPAVVWKNNRRERARALHSSDSIKASDLMQNVLEDISPNDSSLASVVFLVNKGQDGSESFSTLASSGKLPETANKYSDADGIYHHVSGIESTPTMVREASRANDGHRVLQVSLSELNSKLTSYAEMEISETGTMAKTGSKSANKRARDLAKANILVVLVEPDAEDIDSAIASTIDNSKVDTVVLSGIRSVDEVKHERYLVTKNRRSLMEQTGKRVLEARRRRLDEQEGDNENGDNDNDMSGVYYVNMTPNILAGILFGVMFTVVTYIGITCMAAISGQDVYVDKMPTIGREA